MKLVILYTFPFKIVQQSSGEECRDTVCKVNFPNFFCGPKVKMQLRG